MISIGMFLYICKNIPYDVDEQLNNWRLYVLFLISEGKTKQEIKEACLIEDYEVWCQFVDFLLLSTE